MGECGQQKHTQHAPFTKTECDYLNGWIKKRSYTQKCHPKKGEPQSYSWEGRRRRRRRRSRRRRRRRRRSRRRRRRRKRRRRRRRMHRGRPNDPVVRRPLRMREIWGCLPSPLSPGCDQTTGPLVTPLSHAWWYEASARTGWRGVSTPTLGQIARVIYTISTTTTRSTSPPPPPPPPPSPWLSFSSQPRHPSPPASSLWGPRCSPPQDQQMCQPAL